ncbi:MAG: FMN reductase [Pyrinomonadaceae bacterium]|nr:FMN reductase [Pyrinomonadaceae bacterium]
MSSSGVIIQGSARSEGNTARIVGYVSEDLGFEVIDLRKKRIGDFHYDFKNSDDDFLPLIAEIVAKHATIIYATPVYWYSMSGMMKTFFDRITDLMRVEKELGRRLREMNMAMISCGSDPDLPDGFTVPFSETANYLGMSYLGDVHTWVLNDRIPQQVANDLDEFIDGIKSQF